jgi:predicted RNA binding protein YcfA (HicA-like mRNA interferase family)
MPPVPSVRGERLVRALERAGFKVARVTGSHLADAAITVEDLQRLL